MPETGSACWMLSDVFWGTTEWVLLPYCAFPMVLQWTCHTVLLFKIIASGDPLAAKSRAMLQKEEPREINLKPESRKHHSVYTIPQRETQTPVCTKPEQNLHTSVLLSVYEGSVCVRVCVCAHMPLLEWSKELLLTQPSLRQPPTAVYWQYSFSKYLLHGITYQKLLEDITRQLMACFGI